MKVQVIQKKRGAKILKVIGVSFIFCTLINMDRSALAQAPEPAPYRYPANQDGRKVSLMKLKALCDKLFVVSYKVIKEDKDLNTKVEEIRELVAQKLNKSKVFSDKGLDFIMLKSIADELTEDEIARLCDIAVKCDLLVNKYSNEGPSMTEKISAVATQAKEKVVDIGQRIGKVFKEGSQEAKKKAQDAAEVVSEKAHGAKETIKAKASRAGEKVKETGEKMKETGEQYGAATKKKVHDVRQKAGSYVAGARQTVEKSTKLARKDELLKGIESLKGSMEEVFNELEELENKLNSQKFLDVKSFSTQSLVTFRDELLKGVQSLKSRMEGMLDEVERLEDRVDG